MEKKIKRLLPTLQEKKRYITFEVISENHIGDFLPLSKTIKYSIMRFLGEYHAAKAGIKMLPKLWDPKRQRGILKVNHTSVDIVKSAIMLAKECSNMPIIISSIGVSGTIKKAQSRYLS